MGRFEDAYLAEYLAAHHLTGFRYTGSWWQWDGRVWSGVGEPVLVEAVRSALTEMMAAELAAGADSARLKGLASALGGRRISGLAGLTRGLRWADEADFDSHPDLLNVCNGVVDLRTGELGPHDPHLLLTKIAAGDYVAGAHHRDWDAALTALDPDERVWFQRWAGQSATGYMQTEDLLLVLQGGGSNGKSTILGTLVDVLGGHAIVVPEKLLTASPNDHSTELTTLKGARLALIEETPEARALSVKRLKDTVGTPKITARRIREDNITFDATHTLALTTNYVPRISESDHGTWRRLALLKFRKTFGGPNGLEPDNGLRRRLGERRDGRAEAVLAWLVAGAVRHYDEGLGAFPESMEMYKLAWRGDNDLISAFLDEVVEFELDCFVGSVDLLGAFNLFVEERGGHPWSEGTFASRLMEHDRVQGRVERRVVKVANRQVSVPYGRHGSGFPRKAYGSTARGYLGLRFRSEARQ